MDYKKIIDKYQTPLYVFDINELDSRINYLKKKLPGKELVYAVKANTFITGEIKDNLNRFEICSKGEFDICNNLGMKHNKMVISGVYKDYESIDEIMSNYDILKYTVESMNQYSLLKELASKYQKKINILVRLTSGNQFGLSLLEFKDILKDNNQFINIDGIEYFSGTQKHSIKKVNKEVDYLIEVIDEIEKEFNIKLEEIEYGPGCPIFYFQDEEFDEDNYFIELNEALNRIKNKKIYLEIGRSIASSCGYFFTHVVDMKSNKNGNTIILDGGINHLVYYGQTMAMRIPYFTIYPERKGELTNYNLYGSLCTVNDILVKNINVSKLELNDVFIFKNCGAYSITEGISLFLSRDLPEVVLYKRDKSYKIVRGVIKTSNINFPNYEMERD